MSHDVAVCADIGWVAFDACISLSLYIYIYTHICIYIYIYNRHLGLINDAFPDVLSEVEGR